MVCLLPPKQTLSTVKKTLVMNILLLVLIFGSAPVTICQVVFRIFRTADKINVFVEILVAFIKLKSFFVFCYCAVTLKYINSIL